MTWWVYFASTAQAGEADTLSLALEQGILSRPTHTSAGKSRIANVSELKPGNHILLVYRDAGPHRARAIARIAVPEEPVPGIKAIDRITGELAVEMTQKGYPPLADGSHEAIRLETAEPCDLMLEGKYGGRNAIHRVEAADNAGVRRLIRQASR